MSAAVTLPPPATATSAAPASGSRALTLGLRRFGGALLRALLSLAIVVVLWQCLVWSWGERLAFSTRGPKDVWLFLFGADADTAVRSRIFSDLWTTLVDAGLGLAVGTVAAIAVAFAFVLVRPLEQGLMPLAMVLRSVPLVAMTPLMATVFGRGVVSVAMVGAIVTFFPMLVNLTLGMRSAPQQTVDLVRAYGGGRLKVLFRVQFPSALPQLFAAFRAAAPLAITGAMLAEFLLTGTGLGNAINIDRNQFKYSAMWAQAAIATLFSVLIYAVASGVEGVVLARFAPDRLKAAQAKA